jgi:hypothetical protein
MAKQQKRKRRPQIKINTFCRFTAAGVKEIDYKDVGILLMLFSLFACIHNSNHSIFVSRWVSLVE